MKLVQDWGVAYLPLEGLELAIAQGRLPTTSENWDSTAELLLPDRSMLGRYYGDKRQQGLVINYKMKPVRIGLMVSNGTGPNVDDTNVAKDLSARAEVNPIDPLTLGVFTTAPDSKFSDLGKYGANVRWAGQIETLRFEYAQGKDTGNVSSRAMALEAGAKILPVLEPVFRYDMVKVNKDRDGSATAFNFGLNYFLLKHNAKLQGVFTLYKNATGGLGTVTPVNSPSTDAKTEKQFVLSYQMFI